MKILSPKISCHTKHSIALIFNMGILYQLDYNFTKYKRKHQRKKKVTPLQIISIVN